MKQYKNLREKVQAGLQLEEQCDILFSMVKRIEEGEPIGNYPEEVLLDEDNCLRIERKDGPQNLVFSPPEMRTGVPAAAQKPQRWFALGMYAYYMYYREDFYTRTRSAVLAPRNVPYVIQPGDVSEIPYGTAVSLLTAAADVNQRVEGLKAFLTYLHEKMPGTANIWYVINGKEIGKQTKHLREDIEDLCPNGINIKGMHYDLAARPVCIPYRPGTHTYRVEVVPNPGERRQPPKEKPPPAKRRPGLYLEADTAVLKDSRGGEKYTAILGLNGKFAQVRRTVRLRPGGLDLFLSRVRPDGSVTYLRAVRIPLASSDRGKDIQLLPWYDPETDALWVRVQDQKGADLTDSVKVDLKPYREDPPQEERSQQLYLYAYDFYCDEIKQDFQPCKNPESMVCVLPLNGADSANDLLFYIADTQFPLLLYEVAGRGGEPELLKEFTFTAPSDYTGLRYTVQLHYSAWRDQVRVQLADEDGREIAPPWTLELGAYR